MRAVLAAAMLGVVTSAPPASAQAVPAPDAPEATTVVEIGVDGRLTVDAWETPWPDLLDALRRKAGIVVRWTPPPTGSVTSFIKDRPVEQALRSLSGPEVQLVFAYESVDAPAPSVVWVLEPPRTGTDRDPATDAPADPLAGVLRANDGAPADAVAALVEALRDPDATVRAAAAQAIGELRPAGGAEALRIVLDTDPHPDVKAAAAAALVQIERDAQATVERSGG